MQTILNEPIFGVYARLYYDKGIPVIPLQPFNADVKSPGKQPIPVGWSAFAKEPVPANTQDYWITNYPNANMGLVTGPVSNIMFIDVDSDDPKLAAAVARALGIQSPWVRVGQKGYVAAYRFRPEIKNFRIKDINGNSLVECLALGCQAVIPPSIHPKTKSPYVCNANLLDVHEHLPLLPVDTEDRMRYELQHEGFELSHTGMSNLSDFVARGARDNQMTYVAGLFAHYVTKGERTLEEAFGQMEKWFDTSVQKVDSDDIDLSKGKKKIVEFLQRDVTMRKKPLPIGWDMGLHPDTKTSLDAIFTPEHVEWTAAQIKAYAYDSFMKFGDIEDPRRMEAINYLVDRLARSPSLSTLEMESIIAYIAQTSRIPGMSIPNLRKRIRELRQGDISGFSHMEIATAVKERMEEFGTLRQMNGVFYQWKGAQWDPLEDVDILRVIAEQFDGFDITKKQHDHVGIVKVMRAIVPHSLTERPARGINFANGFLHHDEQVKRLVLKPHLPEFGATYTLPYRYVPELSGKCTNFLRLLYDSWGHDDDYEDKVIALQQMIAASYFQYGTQIQRCCLLYGVANSGKSTIINVIKGLFPSDMVSVIPPNNWQDRFAPAMMAGKLLNVCGELPEKHLIDGKSFKEIIDGSELTGQFKNQQLFKFIPVCTHWFASNHPPKTLDTSEGFNRRFLILYFSRAIELAQKIIGLHNQIIGEEREAIAAWAIEAFLPLLEQKEPTLPSSHTTLINDIANQNNSVRFFLNESRRIMTKKKLVGQLAATTRQNTETNQQATISDKVIPIAIAGAQASPVRPTSNKPAKRTTPQQHFSSVEAFSLYASTNPISEETLYLEYTMFCGKQAGVKAVGVRHFRERMRELEQMHAFKTVFSTTPDGYEVCSYMGIVLAASTPTS